MTGYEVYALKYAGPFTGSGALHMWMKEWDSRVLRNYYIWCLKGAGETVVVDTGVNPALAAERELAWYVNPAEVLSRIGMSAEAVRHVIITHMHWDHASGIELFPQAVFYIQATEYDFWLKDPVAERGPFARFSDKESQRSLGSLEGTDRLRLLNGDTQILPGVECLLAPGHTVGLQAVAVNTDKGTAILGSDCAHTFRNYREDWPSALITDLPAWMRSFDKLKARATSPDLLFPGHDVLMAENYPEAAPGVTRLV